MFSGVLTEQVTVQPMSFNTNSGNAYRGCEPGEQYDVNVCRECQEQTYSFHPGDNGGQCQTCPDVAHCPGGPIFVPDDYYWHNRFDSDTAQRCPNTFACR